MPKTQAGDEAATAGDAEGQRAHSTFDCFDHLTKKKTITEDQMRDYQTFLFEAALKENIIVCLPTSSWKSFLAVQLIKEYLPRAVADNKNIVFVASTVSLVRQQAEYIRSHIVQTISGERTPVVTITGDSARGPAENWDTTKWNLVLSNYKVLVMTDAILTKAIEKGIVSFHRLCLLVVDECHNAVKNHPMARLMKEYSQKVKEGKEIGEELPKVLGLTATIIKSSHKNSIAYDLNQIQSMFQAKAITYTDYEQVLRCSTSAIVDVILCQKYCVTNHTHKIVVYIREISRFLRSPIFGCAMGEKNITVKEIDQPRLTHVSQIMDTQNSLGKLCAKLLEELIEVLETTGPYCFKLAVIVAVTSIEKLKRLQQRREAGENKKSMLMLNYIGHQLTLLVDAVERLIVSQSHLDPILDLVSPKLAELQQLLRKAGVEQEKSNIPFCGILFCKTRISAQILAFYLKDLAKSSPVEFGFLRTDFVIGCSSGIVKEAKPALATQKRVLQQFQDRELNFIVATTVIEEGLNVPDCNVIIHFNVINSYPSFIQSLGRARQRGAKLYILCDKAEEAKQKQKIADFQEYGEELSKCLQLNEMHADSSLNCLQEIEDSEVNMLIPPFLTGKGSQKITALSAVGIVYEYCQSLANDKLSVLTPRVWLAMEGRLVYIRLPPSSMVKEVHGDLFDSKFLAIKSAFLMLCVQLWKAGALNPDTFKPYPRHRNSYTCDFLEECEKADPVLASGERKIGSKNRFNWFSKSVPEQLTAAKKTGSIGTALNIYAIEVQIEESAYVGKPELYKVYEFKKFEHLMGIITSADLMKASQHVLLSQDGNFRITLRKLESNPVLTNVEFATLLNFQEFVFGDLLQITHLVFSRDQMPAWLFAPLKKADVNDIFSSQINWSIIPMLLESRNIDYKKPVTEEDRRKLLISPDMYDDKVVIPWCSTTYDPKMYCVLQVDANVNPRSAASPGENLAKGATYEEYYKNKYDVIITNKTQPLLVAKPLSQQLNLLGANYNDATVTASKAIRKDSKYSTSAVTLIPELVRLHPIPASLLAQIKFLPSCIHRITRLLIAEDLRKAINVSNDDVWKSEDFTLETSDYLDKFSLSSPSAVQAARETGGLTAHQQAITFRNGVFQVQATQTSKKRKPTCSVDQGMREENSEQPPWSDLEHQHPSNLTWSLLDAALWNNNRPNNSSVAKKPKPTSHVDEIVECCPVSPRPGLAPEELVPIYNFNRQYDFQQEKGPMPFHIMEAITISNANDAVSLEKMELLGDSVLKFVVTTHIVSEFGSWNEGMMTCLRTRLISNRHLYGFGNRKGLGSILAGSIYESTSWLPPGAIIPQRYEKAVVNFGTTYSIFNGIKSVQPNLDLEAQTDDQLNELIQDFMQKDQVPLQTFCPTNQSHTHVKLGDKSVANCVKALIGVYYLNGGIHSVLKVMNWLGLKGPTGDSKVPIYFQHYLDIPCTIPEYPDSNTVKTYLPFQEQLEKTIGYKFQQPWLMVEALTHPTYSRECMTSSYERLEFIGEAVLDFLVTHHIYTTKMAETPGNLTDLRSALVNNITFGSLAVKFGLHSHLLFFSPQLDELIEMFASKQKENGHNILGQFNERLVQDLECVVAQDIEVPKVLGDIWESMAGAIYLDSGHDLDKVWSVFYRLMQEEIETFSKDIPISPVREIMEKFPLKAKFTTMSGHRNDDFGLKIVKLEIEMFEPFYGCGTNKCNAKIAAAKFALKTLNAKTSGEKEKAKSYLQYSK